MTYSTVFICPNKHISSFSNSEGRKMCTKCGMKLISKCAHCGTSIQGIRIPVTQNIISLSPPEYEIPNHCHECGEPYPWTKKTLEAATELITSDNDIPTEMKELLINHFPNLIVDTPQTQIAIAHYKKCLSRLNETTKHCLYQILFDVASEFVKTALFGKG